MPIQFDVPLDTNINHYTGINNIIRYFSDNTTSPITYSTIGFSNIGNPVLKKLYPSPIGKFYYNFKEIMYILMNNKNFEDNINYSQLVNNWSEQTQRREFINIRIYFEDLSFEEIILDTNWLSVFYQYWEYNNRYLVNRNKDLPLLLKPYLKNEITFIKYWVGYPFSFGFYTGSFGLGNENITINSGLVSIVNVQAPSVTRVVISNGIENNLFNGLVNINNFNIEIGRRKSILFKLEKITPCYNNQVYLKWLNSFGDYDYWLFEEIEINRSTKTLGVVYNDFNNFTDTISPYKQIGFDADDSIDIYGTYNANDILYISDLIISPKVYMFTGVPNSVNDNKDWIEVKLKSNNMPLNNRRRNNVQFKFTIEMPDLNTRKL